jgi:hypothetical protein
MKIPQDSHDRREPIKVGFAYDLVWRNTTRPNSRMGSSNYIVHFPSWSWISRIGAQTKFQYFGRIILRFIISSG